jgi:hypothetical protein
MKILAQIALPLVTALTATLLVAAACQQPAPTLSPPAGVDACTADPTDACPAYCTQARAFECPEGNPSARGESCEALCTRLEGSGEGSWPLVCVAGAKTREQARACVSCSGSRFRCIVDGGAP